MLYEPSLSREAREESALTNTMNPPNNYLLPSICTPPGPPAPGQPGYGAENPFPGGIYYDPTLGMWWIPEGYWHGDLGERTPAEVVGIVEQLLNPPPQRPAWAIFDAESDGRYYWGGGYWGANYYAEGSYWATEIH